ncbi:hypothetical protein [Streptomyces sp. NPDC047829]|uniref:hypothetical protein n=1 Tax=Streptomyces sp. NPDC047829 TaxID=3154609 RepID=UPI0033FD77FD
MVNNLLWHVEFGLLDIRRADLGRPELRGLRRFLLADTRLPLEKRELQCGGVCRQLGYVEWMYVYERNGQLIAAHQRSSSEQRHQVSESAEHQAYKERTVRVAVEAGHRAETEVRTPDGKVRSDVLIYGAADTPTSFAHPPTPNRHIAPSALLCGNPNARRTPASSPGRPRVRPGGCAARTGSSTLRTEPTQGERGCWSRR